MHEDFRYAGSRRIPALLQRWLTLVEDGKHFQLSLEPIEPGLELLTPGEISSIREQMGKINVAIRKGHIVVTPGVNSVRMVDPARALDALAPGFFAAKAVALASRGKGRSVLATLKGQLIPPGVRIELTRAQTDDLIVALGTGSLLLLAAALESFGLAAEAVVPLALALLAQAAAVAICQKLSPDGRVGFKILFAGLVIVPFPL
jgi:hypothetical protein